MEEQAVNSYSEPAKKNRSNHSSSSKGWRGYRRDLHEGFHVLEQKARRGEHKRLMDRILELEGVDGAEEESQPARLR